MTKFIVTLRHNGNLFALRSTVWTGSFERATLHDTHAAANAALLKAKPFMKAAQYKAAQIVEVPA